MSNIYELFEQRKEGLTMLEEGFGYIEPDDSMDFDTIEEGLDVLDDLAMDVSNGVIKLLAEDYITTMCLESAMDDDLDDFMEGDYISESVKEKAGKAKEFLSEKWQQFKGWILRMIETVKNFFLSNDQFFKKYGNVTGRFANRKGEVKTYEFNPRRSAFTSCMNIVNKLKLAAVADDFDMKGDKGFKEKCFAIVGVKDNKGLKDLVKSKFIKGQDKKTMKFSDLDAETIVDYAANKKDIIDSLKKFEKNVDADFMVAQQRLKEEAARSTGDDKKNANSVLKAFDFIFKIKTNVINLAISCVKSVSKTCFGLCKAAVNGAQGDEKIAKKARKDSLKQAKKEGKKAKKAAKKGSSDESDDESTEEAFSAEIYFDNDYDDSYDDDDFDW